MSYTKLQSSIIASTIWAEPSYTRVVWITMLALADRNGYVAASIPGLAHIAHVTRPEVENALYTLMQPDPDSRSKVCEGRRIEEIDGGWTIINYVAVRDSWTDDDKREYQREWIARKRARDAVENVEVSRSKSKHIEAPAPAPAPKNKNNGQQADRFEEWWKEYPKKTKKKEALRVWRKAKLDLLCDRLLEDVRRRMVSDDRWKRGFIPDPTTYLRGERWNDEIVKPAGQVTTPKPAAHVLYEEPQWMKK